MALAGGPGRLQEDPKGNFLWEMTKSLLQEQFKRKGGEADVEFYHSKRRNDFGRRHFAGGFVPGHPQYQKGPKTGKFRLRVRMRRLRALRFLRDLPQPGAEAPIKGIPGDAPASNRIRFIRWEDGSESAFCQ